MLDFCDFIQVYVFTTNHHLNVPHVVYPCKPESRIKSESESESGTGRRASIHYMSSVGLSVVRRSRRVIMYR